ncbi:MAG: hypothetical protein U0354_09010 [Candidatus Sericytochromatia bacterium]
MTPNVIGNIGKIHGVKLVSIPTKKTAKKAKIIFFSTNPAKSFVKPFVNDSDSSSSMFRASL